MSTTKLKCHGYSINFVYKEICSVCLIGRSELGKQIGIIPSEPLVMTTHPTIVHFILRY